ncbi:MAG: hypothetical protein H6R19_3291 [Proteobacteria bacterium]|nr:hypothetical protein [Pseudomonadota bacterium]
MQPVGDPESLEFVWQLFRFRFGQHRIPDCVHAGGKTQQGFLQYLDQAGIILAQFVGRINQCEGSARRGREQGLEIGEAIVGIHDALFAMLAKITVQGAEIGTVQLEQSQSVLLAQGALGQPGRAGVGE